MEKVKETDKNKTKNKVKHEQTDGHWPSIARKRCCIKNPL